MSIQFLVGIILAIPLLWLMARWSEAMTRYRDLYQAKVQPKIPFSNAGLSKAFKRNSTASYLQLLSGRMTISWIKALFGQVEDPELKIMQRKARRSLQNVLLYMVGWFVVGGLIVILAK